MSIESVMPSNRPLILLPSIFPSIGVFSNESVLPIRWPKYWSGVPLPSPEKGQGNILKCFSSVPSLSHVRFFATPWTAACQASLSFTISQSLLKLMSIESVSHPTISSSVVPLSCLHAFPASGYFLMSWFFASGGQSIGGSALASVLPMNIQG